MLFRRIRAGEMDGASCFIDLDLELLEKLHDHVPGGDGNTRYGLVPTILRVIST